MSIGHAATARRFFNAMTDLNPTRVEVMNDDGTDAEYVYIVVKGFTWLGEGCSRVAYRHDASGVVYKWGWVHSNASEATKAAELAAKPFTTKWETPIEFNVHVPLVHHFAHLEDDRRTVLAMEYAEGCDKSLCATMDWEFENGEYVTKECSCTQGYCHQTAHNLLDQWAETYDMHHGNALYNALTNTYWVIDLA